MITFRQQYELISKVWQGFKNGKLSEKVRIKKEDLDYAKIHYRVSKYENYTKENFISLLLYIMFTKHPKSKTDFLRILNETDKNTLIQSLKFKSAIINYNNSIQKDLKIIKRTNLNLLDVKDLYMNGDISVISFYVYYNTFPDKLKGRIAKKEFKNADILLQFFNLNLQELKWPQQ